MEQDQELLDRCLAGEDSAWEALLRGYTRKIYNLCYRFTGRMEEAEIYIDPAVRRRRNETLTPG